MARNASISVGTAGWASRIAAAWQSSIDGILETGRLLTEAKAATSHGDFERMVRGELPFGPQAARKLMSIAKDQRLTDRAHVRVLPSHWSTLYELTQLDDDEFEEALKAGTINPEMQRKDVPRKPRQRQEPATPDPGGGETSEGQEAEARLPAGVELATEAPQDGDAILAQALSQSRGDHAPSAPEIAADKAEETAGLVLTTEQAGEAAAIIATDPVRRPVERQFDPGDPRAGKAAVWFDRNDPQEMAKLLIPLLHGVSRKLPAKTAAADTLLSVEETREFTEWTLEFEEEVRARPEPEAA